MNSRVDWLQDMKGAIHHMDQDNNYFMGQVRCYRKIDCKKKN
jgi:hypothetical protein